MLTHIFKEKKSRHRYLIVFFLIGLYLFSSLFALKKLSINSDEGSFYMYGIKILKNNPEKNGNIFLFHSKMPVCALNALPRAAEQLFHSGLKKTKAQSFFDIYHGRLISVLIGLFTVMYVFKWAKELYGFSAGCFSLFLCCLSPSLIAHSQFVSTDIYATFFSIALFYHTWKYSKEKQNKDLILLALSLALCQISKQSLLFYYFIIPVLLLMAFAAKKNKSGPESHNGPGLINKKVILKILLAIGINLVVINSAFIFYKTGMPLNKYHFISDSFIQIQKSAGYLGNIFLPLPGPFLTGMDGAKYFEQLGGGFPESSYPSVYLLGQAKQNAAFWYYYFVVLFFKLTIPFLIAIFVAMFRTIKLRNWNDFLRNEFFIALPVIAALILFDFFYKAQVGIRHILFIIPLLQVLCGICIYKLSKKMNEKLIYLLAPFVLWQTISVMQYFPHFLPYTNEFILNKKNAYKFIADSNLNYREGVNYLKDYLKKHPDVVYEPVHPLAGTIILNVNDYLDLWNTGKYNWLSQLNKEPVDHIDSQYLIFTVSERDIHFLNKTRPYSH